MTTFLMHDDDDKVVGPFSRANVAGTTAVESSAANWNDVLLGYADPQSYMSGATFMSLPEPPAQATPPDDEGAAAYVADGASLPPPFTVPTEAQSVNSNARPAAVSPPTFPSSPVPAHTNMDDAIRAFAGQVESFRVVPTSRLDAAPKGNRGFSVDSKATQIFMGQLPATITSERLAAAIDTMLGWTDVPLVVHLRPAQGANQASHAIVTVDNKDVKTVLGLNRRAYFTENALYYAATVSDTPTFQRIVSKSINSVSATPEALHNLARACVVVEGANRPKQSSATPSRNSPNTVARSPQTLSPQSTASPQPARRQQHHHQPQQQQQQHFGRGGHRGGGHNAAPPPPPPPYVPTATILAAPPGYPAMAFAPQLAWAPVPFGAQAVIFQRNY